MAMLWRKITSPCKNDVDYVRERPESESSLEEKQFKWLINYTVFLKKCKCEDPDI